MSSLPPDPRHIQLFWRAEFIVVSYLIATIGSGTALQVMKQRTGLRGTRNWLLLAGGTVALAAVGIWSMHFIGMHSLRLVDASGRELDMAFEPGMTVGSLLVAIAIIGAGFTLAGDPKTVRVWRTVLVGFIGGCGVAVMHYMGMMAMVCQAHITWNVGVIVASVIVGFVACTAALLIFFHLVHLWQDDMRLQVATAMLMGVAICAVHYTGMFAASWELSDQQIDFSHYAPNIVIIGVIIAMCVVTCGGLLAILFYRWRQMHSQESAKMQSLTLSIVIRNSQGKVLSTLAGTLPSVVIDAAYSGNNTFTRLSPDFLRMLKISFAWPNLSRYQRHLAKLQASGTISAAGIRLFDQFIAAAETLSRQLSIPVDQLGFMYYSPTGNMVTLLTKSNHANALSVDHTASGQLRFLTPAQMRATLAEFQLPGEVDPIEWLEELKEYQRRVLLPLTGEGKRDELLNELLREVAGELLADKDQIEEEILGWRQVLGKFVNTRHHLVLLARNVAQWATVKLDPMVKAQLDHQLATEARESLEAATAGQEGNTDHTLQNQALVQQVQVQGQQAPNPAFSHYRSNSGSVAQTPGVGLLSSSLGVSVVDRATLYLGLLFVQVTATGLRVMLLRDGPLSMIPLVKFSAQHSITSRELEMVRDGVTGKKKLKQSSREAKAKREAAEALAAAAQNGAGATTAGGGTSSTVHNTPIHTPMTGPAAAPAPLVGGSELSVSKRHGFTGSGVPSAAYLAFKSDFEKSVDDLGKVVGCKADLTMENLWTENVIHLSPEVHVVVFVHCTMQPAFPASYSAVHTSFLPFPIFEIIHFTQHTSRSASAANWTRKLVAATVERGKTRAQHVGTDGANGAAGDHAANLVHNIEELQAAAAAAVADDDAMMHSAFGSEKSHGGSRLVDDSADEDDHCVETSISMPHHPPNANARGMSRPRFSGSRQALPPDVDPQRSPGIDSANYTWGMDGPNGQHQPLLPGQLELSSPSYPSGPSYKYIPTANGPQSFVQTNTPPSQQQQQTQPPAPSPVQAGPQIHYHGEKSARQQQAAANAVPLSRPRVPRHHSKTPSLHDVTVPPSSGAIVTIHSPNSHPNSQGGSGSQPTTTVPAFDSLLHTRAGSTGVSPNSLQGGVSSTHIPGQLDLHHMQPTPADVRIQIHGSRLPASPLPTITDSPIVPAQQQPDHGTPVLQPMMMSQLQPPLVTSTPSTPS